MAKGKAICLSRVSTGIQDLDQQTEKLIEAAKLNGYNQEDLIIIEDKESAVKLSEEERNGLTRMKTAIKENKVDIVICYELSRISRRPDVVYSIRDFLIKNQVQLQVLNPSFKLLKDDGSFDENSNILFSLFSGLAESEGYLRKARLSRGRAKSAAENKFLGGIITFGYKVDENNHYVIDEHDAGIVRRIYKDYQTKTISTIAKELMLEGSVIDNISGARTFIRTILNREEYTGVKVTKRKYGVVFPAIISRETFQEAQRKLDERRHSPKVNTKKEYLAHGILFNEENVYYYVLNDKYYTKKFLTNHEKTVNISVKEMDKITWFMAKHFYKCKPQKSAEEFKNELQDKLDKVILKLKSVTCKIDDLNNQLIRIEARLIKGKITEEQADSLEHSVQFEIAEMKADRNDLEAERDSLTNQINNLSENTFNLTGEQLDNLTFEEKHKLVREHVARIVVQRIKQNEYWMTFFHNMADDSINLMFNPYKRQLIYNNEVVNYN